MDRLPQNLAHLQGLGGQPDGAEACLQLRLLLPPESAHCPHCSQAHQRRYINRTHPWIRKFSLARVAPALIAEAHYSGFPTFRFADEHAFACSEDERSCWDQAMARCSAAAQRSGE